MLLPDKAALIFIALGDWCYFWDRPFVEIENKQFTVDLPTDDRPRIKLSKI